MVSLESSDIKKVGLGIASLGLIMNVIGVLLLFDKGILGIGNILFLSGLSLTIGLKSTLHFFMSLKNLKASLSFAIGFFFLMIGWPLLGMLVESYGFIVLFRCFWPTLSVFLRKLPVIGWIFYQPYVTLFFERNRGKRMPV